MALIKIPVSILSLLLLFFPGCTWFLAEKSYSLQSSGNRQELAGGEGEFRFSELSMTSGEQGDPVLKGMVLNKTGRDWQQVEFLADVFDREGNLLQGAGYYGRNFSFENFKEDQIKTIGQGKGVRILGLKKEQIASYRLRLGSIVGKRSAKPAQAKKPRRSDPMQKGGKETQEIDGHFELGAGATLLNSLSQKSLDSLDDDPESSMNFFPLVRFELNYPGKQKLNRWYLKNEKPKEFTAGRSQLTSLGLFNFSAFYNLPEEEWKDPYETRKKRKATSSQKYGGSVTYSIETVPGKQHLVLGFTRTQQGFGNDLTEKKYPGHGRAMQSNSIFLKYGIRPWQLGYGYTRNDAKGSADSSTAQRIEGDYFKIFSQSLIMVLQGTLQTEKFNARSPLFTKTRETQQLSVSSFLKVIQTSHYQLYGMVYLYEDSNIDFYDRTSSILLAGVGWDF
ncbi:MAG: DUF2860 family protein [SAR324 cluster bacterium]|nr:DUF2860 family protein [SAR324 cluster bacterium]